MRKMLVALVPWMAMATAVQAQRAPATVVYTYQGSFSDRVERDGDECVIPIALAENWGWRVRTAGDEADIAAEGRLLRVNLTKDRKLPLAACLSQLGGKGQWDRERRTFRVLSEVRSVEVLFGTLRVNCALGVSAAGFSLTDPERYIVDLQGATISSSAQLSTDPNIRVRQFNDSTVRVTYQAPGASKVVRATMTNRILEFPLTLPEPVSPTIDPTPAKPPQNQFPVTTVPVASDVVVTPIAAQNAPNKFSVTAGLTAPTLTSPKLNRIDVLTYEIIVPGGKESDKPLAELPKGLLKSWEQSTDVAGNYKLTLHLRQAAAVLFVVEGATIRLTAKMPDIADGTIRGKTVCIDAGHGAHDSGAVGAKLKLKEKDQALKTAMILADQLVNEGCNVIMTRTDDRYLELKARAAIANENQADVFISVHYNSASSKSASGIIIFHHGNSSVGKLLAQCISQKVATKGQLANRGAVSDFAVAKSKGFSVLRNTTMVGVLLELGFLSNSSDEAKIQSDEFKREVCRGVVEGLRLFFGDAEKE